MELFAHAARDPRRVKDLTTACVQKPHEALWGDITYYESLNGYSCCALVLHARSPAKRKRRNIPCDPWVSCATADVVFHGAALLICSHHGSAVDGCYASLWMRGMRVHIDSSPQEWSSVGGTDGLKLAFFCNPIRQTVALSPNACLT